MTAGSSSIRAFSHVVFSFQVPAYGTMQAPAKEKSAEAMGNGCDCNCGACEEADLCAVLGLDALDSCEAAEP